MKRIKNYFNRLFRKHYERRISLPWGITRFVSNIAFIQLTHEQFIELAPVTRQLVSGWVTTTGMRPLLNYAVFLEKQAKWQHVQVIVEINRGFQVHNETPESEAARMEIIESNSKAIKAEDLRPVPKPKFLTDDWELVSIDDPRLEPLKDIFLGFAFYAPFTAAMKKKIEVPT